MKGMELAKKFYETYGRPMIEQEFATYKNRIAVGLVGEGSECFGFDDEISKDHDFGPSFCMWLTDEDYAAIGAKLQAAYEQLPKEFEGVSFQNSSAYSQNRRGVFRIGDFYEKHTGSATGDYSWQDFLFIPEYSFATAVNGEVFVDKLGEFSDIRKKIEQAMPEDIRLKKIAARAATMAQSGQYNFSRCFMRGELSAATVALAEFAKQTAMMIYLLNRKYSPYYKWIFRGIEQLPVLSKLSVELTGLLTLETSKNTFEKKQGMIEEISGKIIAELKNQKLSEGEWDYLEPHAFSVMEKIENPQIRSLHVLQG